MPYSKSFISTHDIDWFIIINGRLLHIASAGGPIPDLLVNDLAFSAFHIASLPVINRFDEVNTLNQTFLSNRLGINTIDQANDYFYTFKLMAQKGIYSFDRTIVHDIEDVNYHLVAWPKNEKGCFSVNDEMIRASHIKSIKSDRIRFDNPNDLKDIDLFSIIELGLLG